MNGRYASMPCRGEIPWREVDRVRAATRNRAAAHMREENSSGVYARPIVGISSRSWADPACSIVSG